MDLQPVDGRKSFYGKAKVFQLDDGTVILKSYDIFVCRIKENRLLRTWNGYSATTMRHVNAFAAAFNLPAISKKEWCNLPVEK